MDKPLMQGEPEHRFSGAYDPEQYLNLMELEKDATCECGASFQSFVYEYQEQRLCLNCALDAAGIERRMIRP